MTKKGPLSLVEKAAIQGLLSQQKSSEEIAETLDRTSKVIDKYIDGEICATDIQLIGLAICNFPADPKSCVLP